MSIIVPIIAGVVFILGLGAQQNELTKEKQEVVRYQQKLHKTEQELTRVKKQSQKEMVSLDGVQVVNLGGSRNG